MSTAPTSPHLSVDEYLNTTWEHDMEYVDGVLVERGMPTIPHSLLQKLILLWFAKWETGHGFEALQKVRVQIIERARYRIPDVMLCPLPLPRGKVCDAVPWAVIEILSPDDTLAETRNRFRDYAGIGVNRLFLLDPEAYVAYRFEQGSLIETTIIEIQLPNETAVPFNSETLFAQLRSKRNS